MTIVIDALSSFLAIGGYVLAILLAALCVLQRKLIAVREYYIKEIGRKVTTSLRQISEEFGKTVPLYEDMIRRDPSIAGTLKIYMLDLQRRQTDVLVVADAVERYVGLLDLSMLEVWRESKNARNDSNREGK